LDKEEVMNVTIKKIARDLKLAVSTVSKALRDSHEISAVTKKRVLEYAERLDYVPNTYASSLRNRRTGNIAVVIPEVVDSFFALAINGIESVAQEKKCHVIIYLTQEDQQKEQSIIRGFRSGRVDGVLISVSAGKDTHPHIRDLQERKVPIVFFDRVCKDIESYRVVTDDFESGYKAAEHLLSKGCKRPAFLSLSENLTIIDQRLDGYKKALSDYRIPVKNQCIVECSNNDLHSEEVISKLLRQKNRPDGIVASVEKLTLLTYSVCARLGISIPHEVKVMGFASLANAALLQPSLTTITQPAFNMGKAAAALLFQILEKKKHEPNQTIVIPSVLHERASTQPYLKKGRNTTKQ